MKIKKFCALFAALVMLTGCNTTNTTSDESSTAETKPTETTAAETTEETTEETTQAATEEQTDEVPEIEGYNLLWHDEFDGDELDETIWTREVREPGWTNQELQEYAALNGTDYAKDVLLRQDGSALLLSSESARIFLP